MFEQTFKNIDNVLRTEAGCQNELDYVEQTSWIIFLKYLDDLEADRVAAAALSGKSYKPILSAEYRWNRWASALIRTDPIPLKIPDPLSAREFARRSAVSLPWLVLGLCGLRSVSTASRSAVSPRLGAGRGSGSGERLAGAPVVSWCLATDGEILCGEGTADASMCPDRWRSECPHPHCVQPAGRRRRRRTLRAGQNGGSSGSALGVRAGSSSKGEVPGS
jgi:hypothetical protein